MDLTPLIDFVAGGVILFAITMCAVTLVWERSDEADEDRHEFDDEDKD